MNRVSGSRNGLADLTHAVADPPAWLREVLGVPRDEGVVTVDQCDIHFFRWGDPSKPGIVMQHGFLAHARCFAFIAPYLANDYHVVAYDHSGMGDSGWRDSYSEEVRVNELLSVCQSTGLLDHSDKPTIIAHSYGGRIGTAALRRHPDRFAGLIICDLMIIRPRILRDFAEKFRPPGASRDPSKPNRVYPDYESAKQRFVLSPPQTVGEPTLFDYMAYHSLKQVAGGWQWKFDPKLFTPNADGNNAWTSIGESVVRVPGRKAIIYGTESVLFTDDSVAYMNELVAQYQQPSIPMIGIPQARHHLMLDQPVAFVSSLKTVLSMWQA